jgi:hypothetical protein
VQLQVLLLLLLQQGSCVRYAEVWHLQWKGSSCHTQYAYQEVHFVELHCCMQ